jgi:hypothetical protein
MDDREVLDGCPRNGDMRDAFGGRRQRRKERERKMANRVAKLGAVRAVPGIDGIERFELGDAGAFHYSHQIQGSVGNSPGAIRETDQREHRSRCPDFRISRSGGFERGERKNNVADRAGANEQSAFND